MSSTTNNIVEYAISRVSKPQPIGEIQLSAWDANVAVFVPTFDLELADVGKLVYTQDEIDAYINECIRIALISVNESVT